MNTGFEPERLLTIPQAAELTSYDEPTIVRWIASGLRHCTGAVGRTRPRRKDIRIRSSDLWDWVDQLSVMRTPAPSTVPLGKGKPLPRKSGTGTGGLAAWRAVKGVK